MSALTFLLKNFPGIIKLSENRGMITRRLRASVRRAFNSKFYREKLTKAGVKPGAIRSIDDFKRMVPLTISPRRVRSTSKFFDMAARNSACSRASRSSSSGFAFFGSTS